MLSVDLVPADAAACPQAVEAVAEADWVVLGPGSWYTSVIPHLLVPELRDALCRTPGKVVVSMNLEPHTDETRGYDLADHLEVLLRHAPELRVHAVLVDPSALHDGDRLAVAAEAAGARLEVADIASRKPGVHDPQKLGSAYARLFAAN